MKITKPSGLRKLIFYMMISILFLQGIIFTALFQMSGVFSVASNESLRNFSEQINRRGIEFNTYLSTISSTTLDQAEKFRDTADIISRKYNVRTKNIYTNQEAYDELSNEALESLANLTTKINVTGAFMILGGSSLHENQEEYHSGVYIKDTDPLLIYSNNSDLIMEAGTNKTAKMSGLTLSPFWNGDLDFSPEVITSADFYDKPILLSNDQPALLLKELGYWSKPFVLSQDKKKIITYTLPLIGHDGFVYGVYGIELSADFLSDNLLSTRNTRDNDFLAVAEIEPDRINTDWFISGGFYGDLLLENDSQPILFEKTSAQIDLNIMEVDLKSGAKLYASHVPLQLYGQSSVYSDAAWEFIGFEPKETLLKSSNQILLFFGIAFLITISLCIFLVFILTNIATRDIVNLGKIIRNMDSSKKVKFDKINLAEIDELTSAIESLNNNLIDSSLEITRIMTLKQQQLEFELDYDTLTRLLNRKSFSKRAFDLINSDPEAVGGLLFADLDNLKYINDTFGHEIGDKYIVEAAAMLGRLKELGGVVARISGDEFAVYMHGFDSVADAREKITGFIYEKCNNSMITPDGKIYKIRFSIGLSWYPSDSDTIQELIKFADYAMYEVKTSIKGSLKEFNKATYLKNAYILEKGELINRLFEENLIYHEFQPIISVKTAEVYGYEALMRSSMAEFVSPFEILTVAAAHSKLYQLEKLTIFTVSQWLKDNYHLIGNKKIFLNSIPSQVLKEEDRRYLYANFKEYYKNVVVEVTEQDNSHDDTLTDKIDFIRNNLFAMLAIDDFGSGYSNEMRIMSINPDIIKIDMGLIRGIDMDKDKQVFVSNIISYGKQRNILMLAEGVETEQELRKLVEMDVDFIQGFFFARPSVELLGADEKSVAILNQIKKELFS